MMIIGTTEKTRTRLEEQRMEVVKAGQIMLFYIAKVLTVKGDTGEDIESKSE